MQFCRKMILKYILCAYKHSIFWYSNTPVLWQFYPAIIILSRFLFSSIILKSLDWWGGQTRWQNFHFQLCVSGHSFREGLYTERTLDFYFYFLISVISSGTISLSVVRNSDCTLKCAAVDATRGGDAIQGDLDKHESLKS